MDEIQKTFTHPSRNPEVLSSFGFRLHAQFSTNEAYRRPKELEWLESLRQKKGLYDPDVKIDPSASKVYPKITRSKTTIVLSRLHQMLFPETDKNWELLPTPEPRVAKEEVVKIAMSLIKPPQLDPQTGQPAIDPQTGQPSQPVPPTADELKLAIAKHVKASCEEMSMQIDDQFTEMDYPEETKKVLRSGIDYGTGIMKGPLVKKRTKRIWEPDSLTGDYTEKASEEDVPDLEFVRIWDWYPDMSVTEIDKMEGSFERHVFTKHDLRQLIKRPDFYGDVIEQYIEDHKDGDYVPKNWEADLQVIEIEAGSGKEHTATNSSVTTTVLSGSPRSTNRQLGKRYELLEYWGYIDGHDLEACGLNITDVTLEYEANVWLLGNKIIKAVLMDKALDEYKVFYYEKDETSIFGEGLPRIIRHSQLAIAGAARMVLDNGACLTGDTEVYRNHRCAHGGERGDNRPSIITLKELWETKHKHNSGLRRTKIRSVNEVSGEIFYNRIVDVFNNGLKSVFEVKTLHGYCIKATDNHRFMADNGEWQELEKFCIGDNIAVNGRVVALPKVCIECGDELSKNGALRCRKCASKKENNPWNKKQAEDAETNMNASESTARQRWACQKDKKDSCERCGARDDAGVKLDIHHKDRNPHNNDPSNKLTLCHPCHMWLHSRHDFFGQPFQHRYVDYDEIVSIEYMGEVEVFDLQLEAPNHNFVANGFVVHNCVAGPQVEVNWSLMTPGTDINSFYPRKIWFREGRGVEAQYPAIRSIQFDSHIEELLMIIKEFKEFGDEETCLPTWMIGQQVNNETAQATSGRLATITVSIKDIVKNFDAFTEKIIRDLYAWNMEFNPRTDIKGDFLCKARGVASLVMKEVRMQALLQRVQTMQPEDWVYYDRREFNREIDKAHDLNLTLKTQEEVDKIMAKQKADIAQQTALAIADMQAEVGKKQAQSAQLLARAKAHNVTAEKDAATPPETNPAEDPRLAEADLAAKELDMMGKEGEMQRQKEKHTLDMQHQDEAHQLKMGIDTAKTASDIDNKSKVTEHGMKMKEKQIKMKPKAVKGGINVPK